MPGPPAGYVLEDDGSDSGSASAPPAGYVLEQPASDDAPSTSLDGIMQRGVPTPAVNTTATGAFLRGAAHEALPTFGGVAGMTVGAEGGAALGALTSPLTGPIGPGVGTVVGGGLGALGGAWLVQKAQDKLSGLAPGWLRADAGFGDSVATADLL